jgi:hypothetical protein
MEPSSAIFESIGFWVFVVGVSGQIFILIRPPKKAWLEKSLSVFFLVVIVAGALIDKIESHSLEIRLRSLQGDIKAGKRYSADRLLEDDDVTHFNGIPHEGLTLHLFSLTGDHEAERFAKSIKQILGPGLGLHWRVDLSTLDEDKLGTGLLPGAIFGPFGGDEKTPMLSTATIMLYSAFFASDFCIDMRVPLSMRQLADPSPSAISLIIGPKNRKGEICR